MVLQNWLINWLCDKNPDKEREHFVSRKWFQKNSCESLKRAMVIQKSGRDEGVGHRIKVDGKRRKTIAGLANEEISVDLTCYDVLLIVGLFHIIAHDLQAIY
jgi:hypothetical protein